MLAICWNDDHGIESPDVGVPFSAWDFEELFSSHLIDIGHIILAWQVLKFTVLPVS